METDRLSSHPAAAAEDAATRRAKKRELDRRAQRAARERNRSRIANLEAMVNAMSHQESSSKIASLFDQLSEMTRQRNALASALSSIETVIQSHQDVGRPGQKTGEQPLSSLHSTYIAATSPGWLYDNPAVDHIQMPTGEVEFTPDTGWELAAFAGDSMSTDEMISGISGDATYEPANQAATNSLGGSTPTTTHPRDPILPYPDAICDCVAPQEHIGTPGVPSRSIWRSANEALSSPELLSENVLHAEDAASNDIPVRVILEGWDSVEQSGKLPPLWRKLRRTDELQFAGCGRTERLAILKLMHCLLRYQAEPTAEQCAKLPPWYLSRPSQAIPHSSAIDFFVWPGVRERFIFSQHRYCSNFFWKVFAHGFRIRWPFEFRDCYKRNVQTGQFCIAPEFERCIRDIGSWTMSADFFGHFPEMYADIPAFQEVPRALAPASIHHGNSHIKTIADKLEGFARDESEIDFLALSACQDWGHSVSKSRFSDGHA